MSTQRTLRRLRRLARQLATVYDLPLIRLDEMPNTCMSWGDCDDEGYIRIRLLWHKRKRELPYSSLVRTLCHEMAHLAHFDHSFNFVVFESLLLADCHEKGLILRPVRR